MILSLSKRGGCTVSGHAENDYCRLVRSCRICEKKVTQQNVKLLSTTPKSALKSINTYIEGKKPERWAQGLFGFVVVVVDQAAGRPSSDEEV